MRRRKAVRPGNVIAIPLPDGHGALAKVIYVSESFKDLMGLRVWNRRFTGRPALRDLDACDDYLPSIIYTGTQSVGKFWTVIGNVELAGDELHLTKRVVGDSVYIGDENLGRGSVSDLKTVRSMGVLNMYGVQDLLYEKLHP